MVRSLERLAVMLAVVVTVALGFVPTITAVVHDGALPAGIVLMFQAMLTLAGLMLWWTRRSTWHSALLLLAGVLIGVSALSNGWSATSDTYLSQIGWTFQWSAAPVLAIVVLCYPEARVEARSRRVLVALWWVWAVGFRVVESLLWSPAADGYTGPNRWLTAHAANDVEQRLEIAGTILLAVLVIWLVLVEAKRWRGARGGSSVAVRLVAVAGALLAVGQFLRVSWWFTAWGSAGSDDWIVGVQMATGTLGAAMLVAVAVQASIRRGLVVERLLGAGGDPSAVQEVLGSVLADPTLRLRFAVPSGWVGIDGANADGPTDAGRTTQVLVHEGARPVVELEAEDHVLLDPAMLRVTLAAAAMVLANALLTLENAAHLAEVNASRARIVEAGITQRRQLERDLHDGAQQRLLAVSATLTRASMADSAQEMRSVVDDARADLTSALAEVRRLARGIHPAALSQGGLVAGLRSLTDSSPTITLRLDDDLSNGKRWPPAVESTAYFVVAEALANAAKHAPTRPVIVSVAARDGALVVTVCDDGPGGATAEPGGGLAGLSDRVRALGGVLTVDSTVGQGTTLRAWLPDGGTA